VHRSHVGGFDVDDDVAEAHLDVPALRVISLEGQGEIFVAVGGAGAGPGELRGDIFVCVGSEVADQNEEDGSHGHDDAVICLDGVACFSGRKSPPRNLFV
jgi:hypothetical protein